MANRLGGFLLLIDEGGRRNLVRIGSIQMLADADEMHDSTIVVVAGRCLTVPRPLDDLLDAIMTECRR
jgi:hypothetical protein